MDKKDLMQYLILEKEVRCLKGEIKHLRESYLAPYVLDGMPGKKSHGDRIATLTEKIIGMDELLTSKMIKLMDQRALIEDAIDALESADRLLLRLKYIEGKTWEDVADEMSYSTRRVLQLHEITLKKLKC